MALAEHRRSSANSRGDSIATGIFIFLARQMKNNICKKGNFHLIGIPQKHRATVFVRALGGLSNAARILKYKKNVDVVLFDAEYWDILPQMSISAHARIYYIDVKICFYRKDKDIDTIINIELPLAIHHELSHVVRANTVGYSETLLDSFVDEGIACFVEQSVMPKRRIPYIQEIDNEQTLWLEAKKHLLQKITTNLHSNWFFGTGTLPNWIGYRLGYLIVQQFMNKHAIRLDTLVRMSSKKILKGSGLKNYLYFDKREPR